MKKINKTILIFILILTFAIVLPFSNVKAVLQSNPTTHYKTILEWGSWMKEIRRMEEAGNAMGLNETLNTDLTSSSKSNNIDVHMMKSTEYGAMAILSASGYGNPKKLQESTEKTTTGNKTGVYISGESWECVAGGVQGCIYSGVNQRYFNSYTKAQESAKIGDALGTSKTTNQGCAGWHDAKNSYWVDSGSYPNMGRGKDGLFSYGSTYFVGYGGSYCRGVAVCGIGL